MGHKTPGKPLPEVFSGAVAFNDL